MQRPTQGTGRAATKFESGEQRGKAKKDRASCEQQTTKPAVKQQVAASGEEWLLRSRESRESIEPDDGSVSGDDDFTQSAFFKSAAKRKGPRQC